MCLSVILLNFILMKQRLYNNILCMEKYYASFKSDVFHMFYAFSFNNNAVVPIDIKQ